MPKVGDITKSIGISAVLEQLAEELFECGAEVMKLARIERGENPTPKDKAETYIKALEESCDVLNCMREAFPAFMLYDIGWANPEKMERWMNRINSQK